MDGFGASAAFHMAQNLRNFPESSRKDILDLLFSTTKGAGLSMVRNIVGDGGSWGTPLNGPTPSIEPAEGTWNWTGDEEQIWFMKEAAARGCTRSMSTVWSPPAWMKTNHNVIKGGLDPIGRCDHLIPIRNRQGTTRQEVVLDIDQNDRLHLPFSLSVATMFLSCTINSVLRS